MLDRQKRAVDHILQTRVRESLSNAELMVNIVLQVVVYSVDGLFPSIDFSDEHVAVEIEQEDGAVVQQVLVVVVHVVLRHQHHELGVLVGVREVVLQILDRVRRVHHALPHRLALLPHALDPQSRRQQQPALRQEPSLERAGENRAGRLHPLAARQRAPLEDAALHQLPALVARALAVEHAVVPRALVERLLLRSVDQRAAAVRNAVEQLALVEQRRREAHRVGVGEGRGGGQRGGRQIGVEGEEIGAVEELVGGFEGVVGERRGEARIAQRGGWMLAQRSAKRESKGAK